MAYIVKCKSCGASTTTNNPGVPSKVVAETGWTPVMGRDTAISYLCPECAAPVKAAARVIIDAIGSDVYLPSLLWGDKK